MSVLVAGAGAFGTALAVAISANGPLTLWARDTKSIAETRESTRLPGVILPDAITITSAPEALIAADTILVALPAQALRDWLAANAGHLAQKTLIACCKGIDIQTLTGPAAIIRDTIPSAIPAILSGPSFAADIARGLPTALTLACADAEQGAALQAKLSTPRLRLYRSTDLAGVELGGALKNVIAIACGVTMGAGLGESARAAVMTRGFAEMTRIGAALGARPETLAGLSGFGDLALTCTSEQSRNYRYGYTLGQNGIRDTQKTVEGIATAQAMATLAAQKSLDLPITSLVHGLCSGQTDVQSALAALLARPLKEE